MLQKRFRGGDTEMRTLIAAALLIASQVPSVEAGQVWISTVSTTDLIDTCHGAKNTLSADCAGYIIGVFDTMSVSGLICPPPNPSGLTEQAIAVALKFLNDHPEQWHRPPVHLVGESFKAAFPCGKGRE